MRKFITRRTIGRSVTQRRAVSRLIRAIKRAAPRRRRRR